MRTKRRTRHWTRWLSIGIVAALAALVGGPFVYIHFIAGAAPAPLGLGTSVASPGPSATGGTGGTGGTIIADGPWKVINGSVVGYRVNEVLFGQSHQAVGRTGRVTGSMTVSGTIVQKAAFRADMTSVMSDQGRRDEQFRGRIMETSTYPTATFTLTRSIDLRTIPAAGVERTVRATGDLTLHGVTRTVVFDVTGRRTGSTVQIAGSIPITFADWNIPNPSFGPVTTEDHGVLEFAIDFAHA